VHQPLAILGGTRARFRRAERLRIEERRLRAALEREVRD